MSDTPEPRRFGNVDLLQKISLVWFAMALLCIPVWWKTTSVERYPIPYDEISECSQVGFRDLAVASFSVVRKPLKAGQ